MIRDIVKDTEKLVIPCRTVMNGESSGLSKLIQDMMDTANYHEKSSGCVGLAANQIGGDLRVILMRVRESTNDKSPIWLIMINPVIVFHKRNKVESEEGCLSLEGTRTVKRWQAINVMWMDWHGNTQQEWISGFEAIIVQHEIDHLNGKLI